MIIDGVTGFLVEHGTVAQLANSIYCLLNDADRAKKIGIEQVVFDRGGYKYIGRVKAMAEAAREGGLKF